MENNKRDYEEKKEKELTNTEDFNGEDNLQSGIMTGTIYNDDGTNKARTLRWFY